MNTFSRGKFANYPPTYPLHAKYIEPALGKCYESDVCYATITVQTHRVHAISVTDRDRATEHLCIDSTFHPRELMMEAEIGMEETKIHLVDPFPSIS